MSHVAKIAIEIKDLETLDAACTRLGGTLVRGKTHYKWFGRSVGDYPLPEGYAAADLGQCEHAIRVPGARYEIGVVRRRDGKPGYQLLWDSWGDGGLERQLGQGAGKLVQAYGIEAAKRAARTRGYHVEEHAKEDGSVVLRVHVR
jgi:hypothetical protein